MRESNAACRSRRGSGKERVLGGKRNETRDVRSRWRGARNAPALFIAASCEKEDAESAQWTKKRVDVERFLNKVFEALPNLFMRPKALERTHCSSLAHSCANECKLSALMCCMACVGDATHTKSTTHTVFVVVGVEGRALPSSAMRPF